MGYYPPTALYAILAIGVACHSIATSRLVLRHPSPSKFGLFGTIDFLLLITWMPLFLYQFALIAGMSPEIGVSPELVPYHDEIYEVSRVCKQIAYFAHAFIISMFFLWIPSFLVWLGNERID